VKNAIIQPFYKNFHEKNLIWSIMFIALVITFDHKYAPVTFSNFRWMKYNLNRQTLPHLDQFASRMTQNDTYLFFDPSLFGLKV
jgi:hypothetical protein